MCEKVWWASHFLEWLVGLWVVPDQLTKAKHHHDGLSTETEIDHSSIREERGIPSMRLGQRRREKSRIPPPTDSIEMAGSTLHILWHDDDFIMEKEKTEPLLASTKLSWLVLSPRTHPIRVWSFSMTSHRARASHAQVARLAFYVSVSTERFRSYLILGSTSFSSDGAVELLKTPMTSALGTF